MKRILSVLITITITLILLPHASADLDNGLVAYWPFNGNANDESANGYQGTINGATLTEDRFGNSDSAYEFDGNDYIKASATGLPTGERTTSLWFYANTLSTRPVLLGYGGNGWPGTSWWMNLNHGGTPAYFLGVHYTQSLYLKYYYDQLPVEKWIHFVTTTDSNGSKIYVNGVERASNNYFVNNTYVTGRDLAIGVDVSGGGTAPFTDRNVGYFNGKIDDIRIYNRALSDAEISDLFSELPPGHLDYCREFGPCAEGEGDCDNNTECESGLTCVQVPGTDTCQGICDIPVGHLDYCHDCGPCAEGEGDCDNDAECAGDLICDFETGTDYCSDPDQDLCTTLPVGHADYCLKCGPCDEGEGDCDSNSECAGDLYCDFVPGTDYCRGDCPLPVGHADYCSTPECGPCGAGEGDCDSNSECQSGLSCVFVPGTDVCCPHPLGHLDYCRDCGPCRAGQGDCDSDSECEGDLTCNFVPGVDTCQ